MAQACTCAHPGSALPSRSYYESNDLASALGVVEEALERHPGLVSDDFINMAAELHTVSRQYGKALQVRRRGPEAGGWGLGAGRCPTQRCSLLIAHAGVVPLCRSW